MCMEFIRVEVEASEDLENILYILESWGFDRQVVVPEIFESTMAIIILLYDSHFLRNLLMD